MKKIALLLLLTGILVACKNSSKENFDRAVEVFFLGVLQVINLILFGVTALVFSIISATNSKPVFKTLGAVFLGIFTVFMIMGFLAVTRAQPRHFDIYIIFTVEAVMIIVAFICVLIKPKKSTVISNNGSTKMDDIEVL